MLINILERLRLQMKMLIKVLNNSSQPRKAVRTRDFKAATRIQSCPPTNLRRAASVAKEKESQP